MILARSLQTCLRKRETKREQKILGNRGNGKVIIRDHKTDQECIDKRSLEKLGDVMKQLVAMLNEISPNFRKRRLVVDFLFFETGFLC